MAKDKNLRVENWRPGSQVVIGQGMNKGLMVELIDRAPKGWWAIDATSRVYLNIRRSKGEWVQV